jgi:hypothetical protein
MEVRDLIARALLKVISTQRGVADRKRGRSQGRSSFEAREITEELKRERILQCADRICTNLRVAGGRARVGAVTDTAKITTSIRKYRDDALAELISQKVVAIVNDWMEFVPPPA